MDCDHIKPHGKFYSATRPGGNNKQSVVVYTDTLVSNCYTLGIEKVDIIKLVEEIKGLYFTHALKFICDACGYDYYNDFNEEEIPSLLKWLDSIENIHKSDEDKPLKPIPESVLNEYIHLPHKLFLEDGISISTQKEFEICYSLYDDRIMIPVRDELGNLVGDKGRTVLEEEIKAGRKYLPNFKYSKTKVIYGLYKTLPYIKEHNEIIITEAEKGVMQLWSMGIKNSGGIGSHCVSDNQLEKIIKLNVPVVIAFDKVDKSRTKHYKEMKNTIKKLINDLKLFTTVYLIWDTENVLEDKQSPTDDPSAWEYLYNKKILVK